MNQPKILGLSSVARAGKDTCFFYLRQIQDSMIRYAFADKLKEELQPIIYSKYNIDIFNCSPEDKEKIREEMLVHGKVKREESGGKYWVDTIRKQVEYSISCGLIPVITDVRYKNEADWVHSLGGKIVHIRKILSKDGDKIIYQEPTIDSEIENDPQVRATADYFLDWEHGKSYAENIVQVKELYNKIFPI